MIKKEPSVTAKYWTQEEANSSLAERQKKADYWFEFETERFERRKSREKYGIEPGKKPIREIVDATDWGSRPHVRLEIRGPGDFDTKYFEPEEWEQIESDSDSMPVQLGEVNGRTWWLYMREVFSSNETLESDEVLALIQEKENRKRLKIARAKTVAAMAQNLDGHGTRQSIPREIKVQVWQRDQGRCVQCGKSEKLEFDHIIPHSMGGSDTERNIQLLCETCNREKGASL